MSSFQQLALVKAAPPSRVARVWQALRSSWAAPMSISTGGSLARWYGSASASSGIAITPDSALAYSAVWAAVNLIAAQIGNLPLVLYKKSPDSEAKTPYKAHPLYRLLHDRPNPETSAFSFRQTLQAHLLLWGNGYAEIERDQANRPVALWPLTPDRVQPFRDRPDGPLQYRVSNLSGGQTIVAPSDLLHVPGLGYDGVCGYSVISKARDSIGLGIATERFGGTFFGNGTTFGGALEHPGVLTELSRKNLTESLENRHQGVDRAHKFVILEEGMKYQKFGIPPNDAQFLETRTFQIDEIARWFNLPPHKLKELARSTNNNIEQQNLEYYIDCLAPWCEVWEQELNYKLVAALERTQQEVEFVVDGLMRGDSASRGEFQSKQFSIGSVTPNEIRRKENLNPIAGGDDSFVAMNMIPLALARDYWQMAIEEKQASIEKLKAPPAPVEAVAQVQRALAVAIEERDAARRDLALIDADLLRLVDEKGKRDEDVDVLEQRLELTVQAVRAAVLDRVTWLIEREGDRARRAQGSPEKFRGWIETFYADYGDLCRAILRPSVRAWAVCTAYPDPVEDLLEGLVTQHVEQSVRQFRALADAHDAETLAPGLEQLLRRWAADRAETLVTRILREAD